MPLQNNMKSDIGILGWWYGKNYGSILTYYGLNRAITSLGHSVLMVHEPLGYNGYRVEWPGNIISIKFAQRVGYNYTEQMHYSQLTELNKVVGTFVVGSDQLWNPNIGRVNDDLFLDFVSVENKRVAYGTSFGNRGTHKFKADFIEKHSVNLQNFDAISVREAYAVDIAKEIFGVESTRVVDPVFLLPRTEYQNLANKATAKVDGEFLTVFFLDASTEKKAVAESIAKKLGLKKILIVPNPDKGRETAERIFVGDKFEILTEDSPENFLYAYSNSKYIITDSFHGTAFSIIFGKPFSSIYNKKRGVDRFENLLNSLGFGETRRVFETDSFEIIKANENVSFDIEFSAAHKYIEIEKDKSMRWLEKSISSEVQVSKPIFSKKSRFQEIVSRRKVSNENEILQASSPVFVSNSSVWSIVMQGDKTSLSLAAGASIRGNLVWTELPFPLQKSVKYRLILKWSVRTTNSDVNLHIRNSETGRFRVIGTVKEVKNTDGLRSDVIDFLAPEDGFNQFMLGAVHFTGKEAGADIHSISIREVPTDQTTLPVGEKLSPPHKSTSQVHTGAEIKGIKTSRTLEEYKIRPDIERCRILVSMIKAFGIKHVVLSPGNRNVSLIRLFDDNRDFFDVHYVTDERSAGFFGLGLATRHHAPVVLCCTSGTAASNYLPAMTEAYYQGIPLLAVTADRYPGLYEHQEAQTINQIGLFSSVVKGSYQLPAVPTEVQPSKTKNIVSQALFELDHHGRAPVHINVPMSQLDQRPPPSGALELSKLKLTKRICLDDRKELWDNAIRKLKTMNRILCVVNQQQAPVSKELEQALFKFGRKFNVVFLADQFSNIDNEFTVHHRGTKLRDRRELAPDLLITLGEERATIVTPPLYNCKLHWRVNEDGKFCNPYTILDTVFEASPQYFLEYFADNSGEITNNRGYLNSWAEWVEQNAAPVVRKWSMSYTIGSVIKNMPVDSLLHIARSNSVRKAHLFDMPKGTEVYCNTGTNGIDGCASTFMGQVAASPSDQPCFLLIGDLAFFYDMNAMWNKNLTRNIRILMNNNNGAGLLRHLRADGVNQSHETSAGGWATTVGFRYLSASSKEEFDKKLPIFLSKESEVPIFFETFV